MSENRIAGYIDTPMMLSPREYIVSGNWISSTLKTDKDYKIKQYRNEIYLGTWKINSVINFITKNGPKIGLKVKSENDFAYFEVGDLVVDQELEVEFYNVTMDIQLQESSVVGSIQDNEKVRAIIYSGMSGLTLATISNGRFHLPHEIIVKSIRGLNVVKVIEEQGNVDGSNPLELRIDSKPQILLTDFLNTVNPLRSFIVGTAKEFDNNFTTKTKKNLVHEPAVELKAGSIRLLLSPSNEGQLRLFDSPSGFPYVLFYKVLASANKQDVNSVIQIMSSNFINVHTHMRNLLSLVRPFYNKGLLEVSLKGYDKIKINETTYSTIKKAKELLLSREVEITGRVYAIDTKRNWFRITDNNTDIDWKVIYRQEANELFDLDILTKGNLKVYATTYTPLGSKRGVAEYVNHKFI